MVLSSGRYLPSTQELPSLLSGDTLLTLPPSQHTSLHPQALLQQPVLQSPCQTYKSGWWVLAKQGLPVAAFAVRLCHSWRGVPRELVPSKEDCRDTAASLGHTVTPSAEEESIAELLYCLKRLSCGFWHALFAGFTTTSCVGGICMVVSFSQILSEVILVRGLCSIARRLD